MKKNVIIITIAVLAIGALFIPVERQTAVNINVPFLRAYTFLSTPARWPDWLPVLQSADTINHKIIIKKDTNSCHITINNTRIDIVHRGYDFAIAEISSEYTSSYTYDVTPDKTSRKTTVTVTHDVSLFNYLFKNNDATLFANTHIYALKNFMETDSLYYGYKLFKVPVPGTKLIELRKAVLRKNMFSAAASSYSTLQQFIKEHHLKQVNPVIAQFLPKGDSAQVNVGLYIDKDIVPTGPIQFVKMPEHGSLLCVKYNGQFNKRYKVYKRVDEYFTDHILQQAILPFEIYLDKKLPVSDTSKVNIQISYSTFL